MPRTQTESGMWVESTHPAEENVEETEVKKRIAPLEEDFQNGSQNQGAAADPTKPAPEDTGSNGGNGSSVSQGAASEPSFGVEWGPTQFEQGHNSGVIEKAKAEDKRLKSEDFIEDRNELEDHLRVNVFDNPALMKKVAGSINFTSIETNDDRGAVRKYIKEELGIKGIKLGFKPGVGVLGVGLPTLDLGIDDRNLFMNLNEDDVDNAFDQVFNEYVAREKEAAKTKNIHAGIQVMQETRQDAGEYVAKHMTTQIDSMPKDKRAVAEINRKLRNAKVDGLSKEEVLRLKKELKIIVEDPNSLNFGRSNTGAKHEAFINPDTGYNLNPAQQEAYAKKYQVQAVDMSELNSIAASEVSAYKDDAARLEQSYNSNVIGIAGHTARGKEVQPVWVDNQGISAIWKERGFETLNPGGDEGYAEALRKLKAQRKKGGHSMRNEVPVLFKAMPMSELGRYANQFKDEGMFSSGRALAGDQTNYVVPAMGGGDYMSEKTFEDEIMRYKDQGYDLQAKNRALEDVYLLNRDPVSLSKNHLFTVGEALITSFTGKDFVEKHLGYSHRKVLDHVEEITAETGIRLSPEQEAHLERSTGDAISEGIGGAGSILAQLTLFNKAQGIAMSVGALGKIMEASKAIRYVKKGNHITKARMAQLAKGKKLTVKDYVAKYAWSAVGASKSAKLKGHLINVMFEEVKMAGALGFDLGTGTGFYLAGAAMPVTFTGQAGKPYNFTSNFQQWNTVRDLALVKSTSFAVGTKFGGLVEATVHDLMNDKTITAHLKETYGDYDALQQGIIVDLSLGFLFGSTHLKANDLKRTTQIVNLRNTAVKKYAEAEAAGDAEAMSRHQEVYNDAVGRLKMMDNIDLYTNPATAKSAYEKLAKGLKEAFEGELEVEIVENGDEFENKEAKGEYVKRTKKSKAKFIININKANPGVIPHEGIHAGMDLLFDGDVVLREKFQRKLEKIAESFDINGASLLDLIKLEKSISEIKKPEELMAYMAEYLAKPEYYTQFIANNVFSNIKHTVQRFAESKLGLKPSLETNQDVVNFLGRYVENVKKGYNPIKQLERLKEVVEPANLQQNLQARDASIRLTKQSLLEKNRELVRDQPEGWRDANKAISEEIRGLNKLIEISDSNAKEIGKYSELEKLREERGDSEAIRLRLSRAFEKLRENNKGILTDFIKEGYSETQGSDITRARFTEEVMNNEFLLNVNSYIKKGDFNVPFGAYLRNNLFGPWFKPGSGKPQRQGNVLRRIQQGKSQDDVIRTMSLSDPHVYKMVEGMEDAPAGFGDIPKEIVEANEGIRLIRDLDVTPAQVKQIEARFGEMLSSPKKVAKLDFKTLKDLSPDFTTELFGGEGFASKTKQAKADFIGKNWKTLYELLPLGASPITGKSTGVATSLQTSQKTGADIFYTKGKDVKFADTGNATGLPVQMKLKLGKDAFLEKLGIVAEFKEGSTKESYNMSKMDRNHETTINNLIKEAGRNITNQVVRDYLTGEKYNENPQLAEELAREQLIHNISSGKSEALQSIDLLGDQLKEKLGIEITQGALLQIMSGFKHRTLEEMKKSLGEEKFGVVKDWIEDAARTASDNGMSALQYLKSIEAANIPNIGKTKFYRMTDAEFAENPKALDWFEGMALDVAKSIPLGLNNQSGNMKVILDLFVGHRRIVGRDRSLANNAFKKGIKNTLAKESKQDWMSDEVYKKWQEFEFKKLKTSYASSYKTGMKKINAEHDQVKKKEMALEYFNSEQGKLSIELYDLWNTTLQEWIGAEGKGSPEYWDKADYILKIKKANSAVGTSGERILAPARYVYLPQGVVEGTIKYEHLKSSSEQSAESALLILQGNWKTRGKKGLKNYGGIYGMLSDFNMVDKATGRVNNSDIFRLAKNLELAKDIFSVESGFKRSLYDDILAEIGQEAVNNVKKTS